MSHLTSNEFYKALEESTGIDLSRATMVEIHAKAGGVVILTVHYLGDESLTKIPIKLDDGPNT